MTNMEDLVTAAGAATSNSGVEPAYPIGVLVIVGRVRITRGMRVMTLFSNLLPRTCDVSLQYVAISLDGKVAGRACHSCRVWPTPCPVNFLSSFGSVLPPTTMAHTVLVICVLDQSFLALATKGERQKGCANAMCGDKVDDNISLAALLQESPFAPGVHCFLGLCVSEPQPI